MVEQSVMCTKQTHFSVAATKKRAIIMTTNRPLEDWRQVLGDTAVAGIILDRSLHHTEVI